MRSILLVIIAVTFTGTAYANSCLEDATDRELLRELSIRLSASDPGYPGGENSLVSSTCAGHMLTLTNTSLDKGIENNIRMNIGTFSNCDALSKQINTKLGAGPLVRSVMIASCSGHMLNRVVANTEAELKRLEQKNMGTFTNCRAEEQRLNSLW